MFATGLELRRAFRSRCIAQLRSRCRVRRAVLTPVIRVTSTPVRLRSRLVIPVVGVDAKSPPLPTASAFPLTRRSRAVPLIGDPQKGMKRIAAGKAKSGRFHDGAPR